MTMEVSVVISTYNNRRILRPCLEAMLAQDFPASDFEIIVADDGSADGTRGMVEAIHAPVATKPAQTMATDQISRMRAKTGNRVDPVSGFPGLTSANEGCG